MSKDPGFVVERWTRLSAASSIGTAVLFTRDQLLDAVWGTERFVTPRSVDVYVRRLREGWE